MKSISNLERGRRVLNQQSKINNFLPFAVYLLNESPGDLDPAL